MCDELTRRKTELDSGARTKKSFADSEQAFGLTFDKDSLLWDIGLRSVFKPITHIYWDWMHTYLTSSGTMTYHMNEMCLDIAEAGVDLSRLDEMMHSFLEANRTQIRPLGPTFIGKHVNRTRGEHMKGFAGEMVSVLCFLKFFCIRTLIPSGTLVEKARSVCLAYNIICLLRLGDAAVGRTEELARLIAEYHQRLEQEWGIQVLKVKAHLQHHIPRCIRVCGFGLACWSNERRNRLLIKAAKHYTHAGNKDSESSLSILCRLIQGAYAGPANPL